MIEQFSYPLTGDQWRAVVDAISFKLVAMHDGPTDEERAVRESLETALAKLSDFTNHLGEIGK